MQTKRKKDLRAKRLKMLTAILTTATYKDAQQKTGLSESSFYTTLRDPEFKAELNKRLDEITGHAVNQIKRLTEQAVATIAEAMNPEQDINTRLRAAKHVLDYYTKHRELNEFDERLKKLEAKNENA